MDNPLDQTTLSTISLLESRLLRIEHLLYGSSAPTPPPQHESALQKLVHLEKRFSMLTSRIRVYGDLLKIYKASPDFFQAPDATEPPSQLPADSVRAIVLSAAPSFPATVSALTAVQDAPVPDPAESAGRGEAALRAWYEGGLLPASAATASAEARVGRVERRVRQMERARELENEI
ncbi:nuclear distribution protein [Beauveria brongniartii RCEF 3172]|uniref:Nuclear distribution protein n=1 Tax=Beauveria brongniartii RCEF 3172 TaxID=1081107 RepID=A0A166WXT5_9HYPO|nr:nuclear distribution protein [Beauveria brongniartii RCEF 3172]